MSLQIYAESRLPTLHGHFRCRCYRDPAGHEAVALATAWFDRQQPVNVRLQSSCVTGEVFGSLRCDCREQLDHALHYIGANTGVVIYLFQEGRGIGLGDKIRAYALQEAGYDTLEANEIINAPVDGRDYGQAIAILNDLQIRHINLLTNNPLKVEALRAAGIEVTARTPVPVTRNSFNAAYLDTKREKCGHTL